MSKVIALMLVAVALAGCGLVGPTDAEKRHYRRQAIFDECMQRAAAYTPPVERAQIVAACRDVTMTLVPEPTDK